MSNFDEDEDETFAPIVAEAPKVYPRYMYHPDYEPAIVESAEEEAEVFEGWYNSPAEYGVITHPSVDQSKFVKH